MSQWLFRLSLKEQEHSLWTDSKHIQNNNKRAQNEIYSLEPGQNLCFTQKPLTIVVNQLNHQDKQNTYFCLSLNYFLLNI